MVILVALTGLAWALQARGAGRGREEVCPIPHNEPTSQGPAVGRPHRPEPGVPWDLRLRCGSSLSDGMTLGKSLTLSELGFLHLWNRNNKTP